MTSQVQVKALLAGWMYGKTVVARDYRGESKWYPRVATVLGVILDLCPEESKSHPIQFGGDTPTTSESLP